MIKTVYRSHRGFQCKDKKTTINVVYEIGEMKSSIGTVISVISVIANKETIEVVSTFDEAMQLINRHWEHAVAEAVDRSIDKELIKNKTK